jgi:hypothetical protein
VIGFLSGNLIGRRGKESHLGESWKKMRCTITVSGEVGLSTWRRAVSSKIINFSCFNEIKVDFQKVGR